MFMMTDAYPGGCQIRLKCRECVLSVWTEIQSTSDQAGSVAAVYKALHMSEFPDHNIQMWALYIA